MGDFVRERGTGAFGTRLRRLSERLDRDIRELYRAQDIDFEPSWFPLVVALDELGATSVGDLAQHTGVSHAAISQIRGKLLGNGLIAAKADPNDQRRQMLQLTAKGRALVTRLRPLWAAIADATKVLCADAAPKILSELDALEAALDRQSMLQRVNAKTRAPKPKDAKAGKKKHVHA